METLRVFRYEHNREACASKVFGSEGESLTGHGIWTSCGTSDDYRKPAFGTVGISPATIMEHERCAVTATQFRAWQGSSFVARKYRDWDLAAYDLPVSGKNTDWREDNNQIVFNPEYATYVGTVTVAQVRQATKDAVKASREAAL